MLLPHTIILTAILIVLGIMSGMTWLSVIMSILLFLFIPVSGPSKKKSAGAAGPNTVIRPIVIRKKYVGPPSIYPEHMSIRVAPMWEHHMLWQKGNKVGLSIVGALSRALGIKKGR